MFGAFGKALTQSTVTFLSPAAIAEGVGDALGLQRRLLPVQGTRKVTKNDMVHNNAMPAIEVDSETYEVRADGRLLTCEPAKELPMTQRYFLF
jgi:urease subunit alpha